MGHMKLGSYVETQMNECPLVLNLADDSVRLGLNNVDTLRLWMSDVASPSLSKLLYYSLKHFHEKNGTLNGDRATLLKGFMADRLVQDSMKKHALKLFPVSIKSNMDKVAAYINGGAKPSFCSEFESVAESIVRSVVLFDHSEQNVDGVFNEQESLANLLRGVIEKESITAGTLCYQSASFRFDNKAQSVQQFIQLMILAPFEILRPQSPFRELVDDLLRSGGFNNEPVFIQDLANLESYSNVALAVRNGSFDLAAYISKCTHSKPSMGVIANAIYDSFASHSQLSFDGMIQEASNLTRTALVHMDTKIKVRDSAEFDNFQPNSEGNASFKEVSVGDWALEENTALYESLTSGLLLGKAELAASNMPLLQKSKRGVL